MDEELIDERLGNISGNEKYQDLMKAGIFEILTEEQRKIIATEKEIGSITLSREGKIVSGKAKTENDKRCTEWLQKKGVLSALLVNNVLVVIYNTDIILPDGVQNLKEKGRAGEFDVEQMATFTDISGSFSYIEEKYKPEWVQQNVRHEIRHAIVAQQDEIFSQRSNKKGRRLLDREELYGQNQEELRQLSYLDELHSQFLDVVEGDIDGHTSFRTIDSRFYSTETEGRHIDVASSTDEGKRQCESLFYKLQGMILLKRMEESGIAKTSDFDTHIYAVGAILATERSLLAAENKINTIWSKLMENKELREGVDGFVSDFESDPGKNIPEITPELKVHLGFEQRSV